MHTKVPARYLLSGDITGSGEIVVSVSAGVHTPRGKVEVTLRKSDGRTRTSLWAASTLIGVERAEAA